MSKTINKQTRDKIVVQAKKEIDFARQYKQGRIWSWHRNEQMYYAMKRYNKNDDETTGTFNIDPKSKIHVELGKMQSFVSVFLSKIDAPLSFNFLKGTIADLKRAALFNALKERDASNGDWDFKDLMGKKQMILYGRSIFAYYADSLKGYQSHLENVDVYDFLIDPTAGGYDIDNAAYLGRYGILKTKLQLKQGIKDGLYLKNETNSLINEGTGNNTETTTEEQNKQNRYAPLASNVERAISDTSLFKLWEWYTTYEGERYYVLMTEAGQVVRIEKLADMFMVDEGLGDAMWPFWSYAATPDLTEFWVPSPCDYVREVFMAQGVAINQMLDNAERVIKPQKAVDINSVENLADLPYRVNGIIRMKSGVDPNRAIRILDTPSINTPLAVYDKLEQIQQIESGVTSASKGEGEEDKVGIYEGNIAQVADRFGLVNKSYANGYKRFARLYKNGVQDNLTKKVAVKILGPDGLEKTMFVGKRDIKPQADYEIMVESSSAEAQSDAVDKKNKLTYLTSWRGSDIINQKSIFERGAIIAGFEKDEVRQLLDIQGFGNAETIAEAERDIESILNKKAIRPNAIANTAYVSRFVEYMRDHEEDMDEEMFGAFVQYVESLRDIVVRNMANELQTQLAKEGRRATAADLKAADSIEPETGGIPVSQDQLPDVN